MAKKKSAETSQESKAPKVKRVFKPESCPSHKFIVESDGRVDLSASHEVTDDSICFNCGLYFSTWVWYSDTINASYWKGANDEAGQTINYVAKAFDRQDDQLVSDFGTTLLEKLRERRKKNVKRKLRVHDQSANRSVRKTGGVKDDDKDGN